jgi:hypothetical protein
VTASERRRDFDCVGRPAHHGAHARMTFDVVGGDLILSPAHRRRSTVPAMNCSTFRSSSRAERWCRSRSFTRTGAVRPCIGIEIRVLSIRRRP